MQFFVLGVVLLLLTNPTMMLYGGGGGLALLLGLSTLRFFYDTVFRSKPEEPEPSDKEA